MAVRQLPGSMETLRRRRHSRAVGVALGVMSMVPGGLGVQEGSMAGTYHLLGVPLEEAVLVSVLFRLVYYVIPFLVSLAFYRRIMREGAVA